MGQVTTEVGNAILTVTLDNPARRNAITSAMWRDVGTAFQRAGEDHAIRAIILRGAGGDFSAGADITEFADLRDGVEASELYERVIETTCGQIEAAGQPTIAALSGYCLGGACHLAMACDFRVCDDTARIGIPAARLSIVYAAHSTRRLVALVGPAAAKRILFTGKPFGAAEALRSGFADARGDDAVQEAVALAASMEESAPLSVSGAKWIVNRTVQGWGPGDEERAGAIIRHVSASGDYAEARAAFSERRPPRFRGE